MFRLPEKQTLTEKDIAALRAFATLCRQDIIKMTAAANSGHTGGSCSIIDALAVLYATIKHSPINPDYDERDRVVYSAGHLSPAAYSVLAEMGYFSAESLIDGFRRADKPFAGHVEHAIPGIEFTDGSLAKGISQAAGIAHAAKLLEKRFHTFVIMGDGEQEEGQVAEARRSIAKFNLNNLTIIIDCNGQQLDNSLEKIAPTMDIKKDYLAAGFTIYEIDGHDPAQVHHVLLAVRKAKTPTVILARTSMGKGISFMEAAAARKSSEWHGKAPSQEQAVQALSELNLTAHELGLLKEYGWKRSEKTLTEEELASRRARKQVIPIVLKTGTARIYAPGTIMDNRSAWGNALVDLGSLNPARIIAMTADLAGSVKMKDFAKQQPAYFIDEGISEQHMISKAGALSLNGFCAFASTFGVFLSALAADQVRINDINMTRLKMVATHCGLSVGEDGMTHQCITDLGFMRGLFNTVIIEPSDPNQTDQVARFAANLQTNVYIRMGRAPNMIVTRKDGSAFYDERYIYRLSATDIIRQGSLYTVIASGAMVVKAQQAIDEINVSLFSGKQMVRLLAPTSLAPLDEEAICAAARETKGILTVEDHNPETGLGSMVSGVLARHALWTNFTSLGPRNYSGSGDTETLYSLAGLSIRGIKETIIKEMKK